MKSQHQVEDVYPLSPMQHGILFHCLYAPDSPLYFVQKTCTLRGRLHVPAFARAWRRVVERHAVLRTSFVWEGLDEPVQVVHRGVELPLRELDWRGLAAGEQQERLDEYLEADRRQGFELTDAPLMRLALVRLADDAHQFVWSYHHLLLDGWCNTIVLGEAITFYESFAQGREVAPRPGRPFRDYIKWLRGRGPSRAEEFWRETLRGLTAPTPLRVDQLVKPGRVPEQAHGEERAALTLHATKTLEALARRHRLTMHTLVQGAWALLLHRYSGEEDVLFGEVVSGRPAALAGVEEMVGLFINTLPVRVRVEPGARLVAWLGELQEQQLELQQYEHSPLVEVQRWSEMPPGASLFDTLFVYENFPVDALLRERGGDLLIENYAGLQATNYPITITAAPIPELTLNVKYDRARFEVGTIRRMLGHVLTLLEGMAAAPESRLADLPLLTAKERDRLLCGWNDTSADYPLERPLHHFIQEQAARTHAAAAVVFAGELLTYGELERRANRLAHHLRAQGVGPEVAVAVLLERSAELVVALLAVLKAGGCYVPLDPEYPAGRLKFMLEDSRARVLLTQGRLASQLPETAARLVRLDVDREEIARCDEEAPSVAVSPDNLAYVIYTSGSTGTPKGAMNTHRAITNRLLWMQDEYQLTAEDRVLQKTPFSFDVSVWEFFWPLLTSARLVVAKPGGHRDVAYLSKTIDEERITTLHFVPSMLEVFLAGTGAARFDRVKRVICSGEALAFELQERFHERCAAGLHNLYGPTEAAVDVSFWACERGGAPRPVPIGRPISNTRLYVLDKALRPVPVGVAGELYIGGTGVGRGYLHRPRLTAEKFIPDPFSSEPGARLYRTGDLAHFGADGELEYLGRIDHQVKVRGFRIELGEIEAALTSHAAVRHCVTLLREDVPGDRELVAYVVADAEVAAAEWRAFLKERVPDYMIPARFVPLAQMPLLPNGKVDRKALPAPTDVRPTGASAYVAPRTPVEEVLAGVWAEVLGLARVGLADDFFELGGHSLRAMQVVSRVRETLGAEVALRELFEAPTLASFAAVVERARSSAREGVPPPPLRRVERDKQLPLSFAQQRLWFLDQLEPENPFYNIPTAVRLEGRLDVEALARSLNEVVRRHESLRTSFHATDGRPSQQIAPTLTLALPVEDLTALDACERERAVLTHATNEARRPFDLMCAPLLRARLLRLDEEEHVLLFTMHHIVSDGWSMGVLVKEVGALYGAYSRDEEATLAELKVQYADYAAWQREWLTGEVLDEELARWRERLRDVPLVLELPTDRPRPPVESHRGASLPVDFETELTTELRRVSRDEGATLFMTALAGVAALLARYTGRERFVVGTPLAGRGRAEVEGLIGFFVNTAAVVCEAGGAGVTLRELVGRVREEVLWTHGHGEVPFDRVVEQLRPARELGRAPVFQVMVAWQGMPEAGTAADGLRISLVQTPHETVKYDLEFGFWEEDGRLVGRIDYSTDLFERGRIERLREHFGVLLAGAAAEPDRPLRDLPIMTAEESERLLVEWNDTAAAYPRELCIHQLFERQAERTPDALAVVCEGQRLSYRELNCRANQLAHYLRVHGVGLESIVGLCLEPSVEMLVGLLGVLKAGGAYLPIDPAYPQERVNFLLRDGRVRLLLTQRRLADWIEYPDIKLLYLDSGWELSISRVSQENPRVRVEPDHLAYVIYTSGSTGQPKGVMLRHRGLVNHSTFFARRCGLGVGDRVLQFASFSFDVAAEEIFPTLLSGAAVVLWPARRTASFGDLRRFIEQERLTVLNLPSPYWHEWVAELVRTGELLPATPRLLVVGSAQTLPKYLAAWQRIAGERVRCCHAYGPTEATITATFHEFEHVLQDGELDSLPIGRPISNVRAYVLDGRLRPVPVGVTGELYVGGCGLARGYLRRPALTAERFIPDPFSSEPGARLYRTGDVARLLADGSLDFVGRADEQLKVRGYRVEPGEIEAVLTQHPDVQEAIVVAREDAPGAQRLVAYVVPAARDEGRDAPAELWPSVGEYPVYDELLYSAMTYDEYRNAAYRAAIARTVKDKTVVEIGTGKDVVLARFCVEAGAAKVYAIESLEESYRQARARVEQLGLGDRIAVIRADSFAARLPERVDVCVSEIIGNVGSSEGVVPVLNDARRFLKDDGVMIPQRCVTRIAAVTLPAELYERPGFGALASRYVAKVFAAVGREFDLRVCVKNFPESHVVSEAGTFEDLSFAAHVEPADTRRVTLNIKRDARLDGFLLWVNLHTAEGEVIDVRGGPSNWLPVYFPAFGVGVDARAGDVIEAACVRAPGANGVNPDYRVSGSLMRQGRPVVSFDYESPHHGRTRGANEFYRRLFADDAGGEADGASARAKLSPEVLRTHLGARLPEYMVPSAFVLLDKLPLTVGGKIDRRALPAPTDAGTGAYVAPRTPVEEVLAGVWAEVLGLARVGLADDFFELGGHSLLATQVVSRVREVFGVELSVRELFKSPALADFAAAVERALSRGERAATLPVRRVGRDGPLPLSFAQQRLWFLDQLEPGTPYYNCPSAVRLEGPLDVEALERSVNEVVRRHESLRTGFAARDGRPAQLIAADLRLRLEVEDLTALDADAREAETRRLAADEAVRPFDLARAPLLRARLLRLDEEEHVLLFTMHHIISDGWSMGVLVREVGALYEAYRAGGESPLAELEVQYADYAAWQREWLTGEVLDEELAYWREHLRGAPPVLELPTDKPRPEEQTYRGARLSSALGAELSQALRARNRAEGVTMFMTLFAGFNVLLHHYSGAEDIVVSTDLANRNRVELEPLIGFFVNQLPLRTDLSGDPTFRELLRRVREASFGAYAHEQIPLDRLVETLKIERSLKYSPLYQVNFTFQNVPVTPLELPGLKLSPLQTEAVTAQLDLILKFEEVEGCLCGVAEYNSDLFEAQTVERMLKDYETILAHVAADPGLRVGELRGLLAEQRRRGRSERAADLKQAARRRLAERRRKPGGAEALLEEEPGRGADESVSAAAN